MRILPALVLAALVVHVPAVRSQEKEPDLATRAKAFKGPFTLIVHLQVKKGEEKGFIEAAKPCIAATRKEKGCIAYELHQDQEDPTRFVFFEKWKSVKDLEAHLAAEHTRKLVDHLGKIAAGSPRFAFYTLAD